MIKATRFPVLWYGLPALIVTVPLLFLWPGWFKNLFASEGFLPHLYCYLEKPGLVLLHVVSDSLIGLAYVAISATLTYLVYRARRDIPFHWVLLAFGLFIITCGATHFMEVWTTLWTPVYWLAGNIKLMTAIASVATAVILPPLIPKTLALVQSAKISEERRIKLESTHAELAELYTQLKEQDRLKTQFFANISHELRTPLTLVLGPAQRLLESDRLTTNERQNLETIDRNARLLLKHVNDLLDLSKIEAGKMTANAIETDLAQLVRFTAAHFELFATERQIAYTVETAESAPARIDPEKIQRVLLNLLSNAFKFTPTGGKVRCLLRIEEGDARLSVQDSGPGVRPELRQVIFEPFRQGDESATRRFGGTGLGLSIANELVALHGGKITVGDAPIGGAQFDITLPLVASTGEEKRPASGPVAEIPFPLSQPFIDLETERKRPAQDMQSVQTPSATANGGVGTTLPLVLVVEDNPAVNSFITESLTPHYRVVNALNGQEGLEKALAHKPDLILSDIMMPEMSGDRMIREIRAHSEMDMVPIIVLTAKADDELSVRMLRQGAQEYLIKPFPVEALRVRVGNLIAIKQTRELLQQEVAAQHQDLVILANEIVLHKRALQQKTAQAEEASRLKTQFLSNVSHELRTPLHAIIGYTSLALDGTYGPLDPALRPAMEGVTRNAEGLLLLVDDLLDLTRIEAGKLAIEPSSLDLILLLRETASGIQPLLEEKRLVLQWRLADPTPNIESDRIRVGQILTNLLANAVKFTQQGKITIGTEDHPERGGIAIWIQDTGVGIPEEELPKIFDTFHQVDGASTREFGGVGLGLAIVKELAGLLQGKIRVESRAGEGSTFTLFLPYRLEGKG
ncbi:MAG: ATP-binding protein [Candidatus Manganitrophus sp. SB1]|nr:ATP-binding protein [Candidatus Manganitrophus morganii]